MIMAVRAVPNLTCTKNLYYELKDSKDSLFLFYSTIYIFKELRVYSARTIYNT
jgi:hypothetical protein